MLLRHPLSLIPDGWNNLSQVFVDFRLKSPVESGLSVTVSSGVWSIALIDQSWGECSINYPCLTEISVHVACKVIPGPQQLPAMS